MDKNEIGINSTKEEMLAYLKAGNELEPDYGEKIFLQTFEIICSYTGRPIKTKFVMGKSPERVTSHSVCYISSRDLQKQIGDKMEIEAKYNIPKEAITEEKAIKMSDKVKHYHDFQIESGTGLANL